MCFIHLYILEYYWNDKLEMINSGAVFRKSIRLPLGSFLQCFLLERFKMLTDRHILFFIFPDRCLPPFLSCLTCYGWLLSLTKDSQLLKAQCSIIKITKPTNSAVIIFFSFFFCKQPRKQTLFVKLFSQFNG